MRKPFIAGNWKMNLNHRDAAVLASDIAAKVGGIDKVDIAVCPPFTSLGAVHDAIDGTTVALGAQNMHWEQNGAYTGEIAPNMLLTQGCRYVILGHSERRQYFGETDESVNRKMIAALKAGLTPIVCMGETREERETNVTEPVIDRQVRGAFGGISAEMVQGTVIAYEPVWAIGTGLTASPGQAQDVHAFIRGLLEELFGGTIADATRIQYGGSMKPENAGELLAQPDIDGGLIGGASLKADPFEEIIRAAL